MKSLLLVTAIISLSASAQLRNIGVTRSGDILNVKYTIDLSAAKVKGEQQLVITPVLLDSVNRVTLPGAMIDGRSRHIRDRRDNFTPQGYTLFRAGKADSLRVETTLPLADWMLDASIAVTDTLNGCNCRPVDTRALTVATLDMRPRIFAPQQLDIRQVAAVEKIRHADGHAYIDFPVNRTEIFPDYRRNPQELANIRDTIGLIKNDPDYTITSVTLKGYASPEGPYANNEALAKGRTEALRHYIRNLYDFPASLLRAEWEAEDWDGLTAYLKSCDLPHRDDILAIIGNPANAADLDRREWLIKSRYRDDYRFLLAEVYPGLRHTDYTVQYTIRSYTSPDELRRAWEQDPRKLSLNELYKLAESVDPATPEYTDIFETAVRLYPESQEANLNAAVCALRAGELDRAARYLDRAGDSPEAAYARGVLAGKRGDFTAARKLLQQAADAGVSGASDAISQVDDITAHSR